MNGGIESSHRARLEIGNHWHSGVAELVDFVGNDNGSINNPSEPCKLSRKHGRSAQPVRCFWSWRSEDQVGFVQSPEALRLAAREDRSRPLHCRVAGRRVSEK